MKKESILFLMPVLLVGSLAGCKNKSTNSITGSSSDTSDPTIVDNKVSQQEYVDAFEDVKNMANGSIEFSTDMSSFKDDGSKVTLKTGSIQKIDNEKLSNISSLAIAAEYDKIFFANLYKEKGANTDEEKKAVYDAFVQELIDDGEEIDEQSEEYVKIEESIGTAEYFGEKCKDDDLFVYDYVDTDISTGQYYKSKVFVEDSDSYEIGKVNTLISLFGNSTVYQSLTYNETAGFYSLDAVDFAPEIFGQDTPDELENFTATFAFADKELMEISISTYVEDENVIQSVKFFNRNMTNVFLPTNILECEHESTSSLYYNYVNDYHYSKCYVCDSVLEYEKHEFQHDTCIKCGHFDSSSETAYKLGLEDEHMNGHFTYYLTNNGSFNGVATTGLNYSYDRDTDAYVYTCDSEECNLKIVERNYKVPDSSNECLAITENRFEIYLDDSETPFKTLNLKKWDTAHSMTTTSETNPDNPCQTIYTEKCINCGLTSTYISTYHDFEDEYIADGCSITAVRTCSDCGKVETAVRLSHKLLNVQEKIGNGIYKCHCDECNEDFDYRLSIRDNNYYGHYVSNRDTGSYGLMPHTYDSNGVCTLCGYNKESADYEVEWLYCYYEGNEYLFFTKNSSEEYISYFYSGYVADSDYETGIASYTAMYSDYNFQTRSFYDAETGLHEEVIVKKGTEVVLSYTR